MQIRDIARASGVPAKTIRYYEAIGLLPPATRAANNYRRYQAEDVERLRFIASARSLGFSLGEIAEVLAARDQGVAPCDRVLGVLDERLGQLDRHIAGLLALRDDLRRIRAEGAQLPRDDVAGEYCVCYLVKAYGHSGAITIDRIVADITAGVQAGQCACDLRNPQGSCCLGNVRQAIQAATREVLSV